MAWSAAHRHSYARPTSIERALRAALEAAGVSALPEYIVGPYAIDLALPEQRIAIEADGDYWHGRPQQRAVDARKDAALTAVGWRVLRFKGSEIEANVDRCVAAVLTALAP